MNPILKNIQTRRSTKSFKSEMPSQELLSEIVKAGTYAPSGMNRQSAIILCVTNKKIRDQLSGMNAKVMGKEGFDPFYRAPVVLVVLADKRVPTYVYDGSLVMGNMMLAAHSLGLGSCWIHRAKEMFETAEGKELLKELGIEGDYEGIGNCVIGYPDKEEMIEKPRKENYIFTID